MDGWPTSSITGTPALNCAVKSASQSFNCAGVGVVFLLWDTLLLNRKICC